MTNKTLPELRDYVIWTHEVDESGDANLTDYLLDHGTKSPNIMCTTRQIFEGFLIWANGENWEEFLDHCKVGDVPT